MDLRTYTTLGRTGLSVSRLGLASGYGVTSRGVERAFREHGINFFFWSTPRKGGFGQGLGSLVRSERDRIVVALQSYDHFGMLTARGVDKGLSALGIDYADILILGWHNSVPGERLMDRARELVRRQKVRFIGMSGHKRATFGALARDPANPLDLFMVRYNAAHPGAERDIFPNLPASGRPGIVSYTATDWRRLLKPGRMPAGEAPLTAVDCYRFALSNPAVDVCLFGPADEAQMDEGAAALARGVLTDEEMARARRIGQHVHG